MEIVKIEKASEKNHIKLTEITFDGKAFWGFSKEQLTQWKSELTITSKYILDHEAYNLVLDSEIIGYYSFYKNKHFLGNAHIYLRSIFRRLA